MQKTSLHSAISHMRFIAIDVETANADMGSICQIGIAKFEGGRLTETWSSLVDPEDRFDAVNISIHGIDERKIEGQPKLPQVASQLRKLMQNTVSVCHTYFDRVALHRAFTHYQLEPISTTWLDSARVARRTWGELAYKGYGLSNVCKRIGYKFRHHDALEDAKAAGQVMLAALHESQADLEYWLGRALQPISPSSFSSKAAIQRNGNPEGDLFGEVVAFTGALGLRRSEAADLAASLGCRVASGVSKKITMLVVGDQDIMKLAGYEKSSKHRKAEQLVAEGHSIRIMCETDFTALTRVGLVR